MHSSSASTIANGSYAYRALYSWRVYIFFSGLRLFLTSVEGWFPCGARRCPKPVRRGRGESGAGATVRTNSDQSAREGELAAVSQYFFRDIIK